MAAARARVPVRAPTALLLAAAVRAALAQVACSPEAVRSRNGGPGADVGNHSRNLPEPSTAPAPIAG